jgi:peptide/nickel transport system permease protein
MQPQITVVSQSTRWASVRLVLSLLFADKFAFISAVFLVLLALTAVFGGWALKDDAGGMNLRLRLAPPFTLENGWKFFLGGDTLGRSIIARLVVASRNTLAIAAAAVTISFVVGVSLGLIAGMNRGALGNIIMRLMDILMSFPSLLIALVILYILTPHSMNVVIILAITSIPVYVRTTRAEVLEIRERMFVTAARALGSSQRRIMLHHVLPIVIPTMITIATLDFATVMLAESSLTFLGMGVQPPDVSWGLMVSEGRNYLVTAWWLSFWPGLAIMMTTLALNLLSGWVRIVMDPKQRWRLENAEAAGGRIGE